MRNVVECISENIKRYRRKCGMTQAELAAMLGYSEKAISKWECGKGMPPTELLPKLARCLETSIDRLMSEDGNGEMLFLGIDGGGTKTDFALADKNGKLIRRVILGASNPNDVGLPEAQSVLKSGIIEVCGEYPMKSISAFAGLAGGSSKENEQKIYNFLSNFGFASLANGEDAENAVSAGLDGSDGVAVIMGTGSVVYAKQGDELYRMGGYGFLLGDEGSGFSIGRDVIHAALRYDDGSGEETLLYKYVKEKCGSEAVFESIDGFYRGGKREIAQYAPLAFRAYSKGDRLATDILTKNIGELAALIQSAAKKVQGSSTRVVICGGLVSESETIVDILSGALSNDSHKYHIEVCKKPMVWGALRLAGMPCETVEWR